MRMANKMGLVTGAASGLGEESAKLIAAEGGAVLVCDIDITNGERVAREIVAAGGTAQFMKCDVSVEADIMASIAEVRRLWGGFNFIHNNAGVQLEKPLHETTTEEWDWINNVNLKGVFWGCKHAVIAMRETGGGAIVNTASVAGLSGTPTIIAYGASKHAVIGLSKSGALEFGRDDIRVNAICPSPIETRMMRSLERGINADDPEAVHKSMAANIPLGRYGEPGEVAALVAFLCSDDAKFISGGVYTIDGGSRAR